MMSLILKSIFQWFSPNSSHTIEAVVARRSRASIGHWSRESSLRTAILLSGADRASQLRESKHTRSLVRFTNDNELASLARGHSALWLVEISNQWEFDVENESNEASGKFKLNTKDCTQCVKTLNIYFSNEHRIPTWRNLLRSCCLYQRWAGIYVMYFL